MNEAPEPVRLDKWLWAARFFKTRSLAHEAIDSGHVEVNELRAKPARVLKAGDVISIRKGFTVFEVVVRGLSEHRGPAAEAQKLYEETEASKARREEQAEQHRFSALLAPATDKRPDK